MSVGQARAGSGPFLYTAQKIFRDFSPTFFDLIVVDECHRGSAAFDSAWREILDYFSSATQIGMTATPKETKYISNINYFGEPTYSCSRPLDVDIEGNRPTPPSLCNLAIDERTKRVARWVSDFLKQSGDRFQKTIIFCADTDHASRLRHPPRGGLAWPEARLRAAIANENADLVKQNPKYVIRIRSRARPRRP